MKKQKVCQKSINEFNQNKRHELGSRLSRKLIILVSPTPWKKIIRNRGVKCSYGGKIMNLHSKTKDETLKYKSQ